MRVGPFEIYESPHVPEDTMLAVSEVEDEADADVVVWGRPLRVVRVVGIKRGERQGEPLIVESDGCDE